MPARMRGSDEEGRDITLQDGRTRCKAKEEGEKVDPEDAVEQSEDDGGAEGRSGMKGQVARSTRNATIGSEGTSTVPRPASP